MPETAPKARTTGILVLAIVAGVAGLYFGRDFFVPIAFAALLNAVFRPVVRAMERARVPAPAGAAVVVLGLLALLIAAGYVSVNPLKTWLAGVPQSFAAAETKLSKIRQPVQQVATVARQLEHAGEGATRGPTTAPTTGPTTGPTAGPSPTPPPAAPTAAPAAQAPSPEPSETSPTPGQSLAGRFLGTTTAVVGGVAEVLLLLYLILAGGGMFLQKLIRIMPRVQDKRAAEEVVHEAEAAVLRYLVVTLFINLGQGAVIALIMWWLNMPTPLLWGLLTVVLEFIPYLGATVMIVLLAVVAFTRFDGLGHILLVPGSYLVITTLQNNLVSPVAYGKRLKLNPVAVLIGVIFWWFVWGIPGAFLAVPIVATMKIVADRTEGLKAVGELLGE